MFHNPKARKIAPVPTTRQTASLSAIGIRKRRGRPVPVSGWVCSSVELPFARSDAPLASRHGIILRLHRLENLLVHRLLVMLFEHGQVFAYQAEGSEADGNDGKGDRDVRPLRYVVDSGPRFRSVQ